MRLLSLSPYVLRRLDDSAWKGHGRRVTATNGSSCAPSVPLSAPEDIRHNRRGASDSLTHERRFVVSALLCLFACRGPTAVFAPSSNRAVQRRQWHQPLGRSGKDVTASTIRGALFQCLAIIGIPRLFRSVAMQQIIQAYLSWPSCCTSERPHTSPLAVGARRAIPLHNVS